MRSLFKLSPPSFNCAYAYIINFPLFQRIEVIFNFPNSAAYLFNHICRAKFYQILQISTANSRRSLLFLETNNLFLLLKVISRFQYSPSVAMHFFQSKSRSLRRGWARENSSQNKRLRVFSIYIHLGIVGTCFTNHIKLAFFYTRRALYNPPTYLSRLITKK